MIAGGFHDSADARSTLRHVTCGCKMKCKTARRSCLKGSMQCPNECGYDAIDSFNRAG